MTPFKPATKIVTGVLMLSFLFGCSAETPSNIGLDNDRLAPCPDSPNCVSSDAEGTEHHIEPFQFAGDQAAAWTALNEAVADLPRTAIVTSDDSYLHAETKSRIFGFVDDVEFHLRADDNLIALRSASRTGHSDFGVNAERMETLRTLLRKAGVLQ